MLLGFFQTKLKPLGLVLILSLVINSFQKCDYDHKQVITWKDDSHKMSCWSITFKHRSLAIIQIESHYELHNDKI